MFQLKRSTLIPLFLLVAIISGRPVDDDDNDEGGEGKKISDESVKGIIQDLEALIGKLPLEHFEGDTILYQSVDTLNDVTSYKANGADKKEPSIYERKSNDKDKKVIVLNPSEDKIRVWKGKKTYVGLRHSGEGDTYFVFYIYLRDVGSSGGKYAKKVGDENKIVEYDSWENREDKMQKVNNGFGWSDCSSSIFIPCKTNENTGFAKPRKDHRSKKKEASEVEAKKPSPKTPEGNFKTEAGFDVDENLDFFWDIEDDIQKARFIGIGLDLMAGGLQAIPNLLSGVFGGITQGVGGLLSGVLGTAGNLVSGVVGGAANAFSGMVGAAGSLVSSGLGALFNMIPGMGGLGSMISGGIEMGTKFLSGMANMAGGMVSGVVSTVTNLVTGVFQAGMGLINSLLSFGGLGSPKAKPADVGLSLGINLGLGVGGNSMPPAYEDMMEEELQQPASGGMGGLLSLDISLEADGPQGRGIMGGNKDVATHELALVMAEKMGENFGKELMKTGLIEHPGWKTMDEGGAPGNTLTHEDDAFVGFGSCEYQAVTKEDFEKATSEMQILTLLMKALRTQCVAKDIKFYERLLSEKYLVLNHDKTFTVPPDSKILQLEKLCPRLRSELSRAFQIALFSKAFKAEIENANPHIAPKSSMISRRVYTLGEVVILGLKTVENEFKLHEVKMIRTLLTTVKAAFTKLLQDSEVTTGCEPDGCAQELAITKNDEIYLMTLMEFMLHGLAPVQKKSEDVRDGLRKFDEANSEVIHNRVHAYLS